jgi:16S rRNA (uracil1498-N3)-methyltransferase
MSVPYFYIPAYDAGQLSIGLDEDTSRHAVQVLRMAAGEAINLTDGKGNLISTVISEAHKKHCQVKVQEVHSQPAPAIKTTIGISLLKNASRFEWFLEKATEIGITEIIPLLCERTEKEKFRQDRLQQILISAMLQSQQCWLPVLHEPIAYELLFRQEEIAAISFKFIAHCIENEKKSLASLVGQSREQALVLIGPEGDFSPAEIALAIANHCVPVTLGATRLRTETAGIYAAVVLKSLESHVVG